MTDKTVAVMDPLIEQTIDRNTTQLSPIITVYIPLIET